MKFFMGLLSSLFLLLLSQAAYANAISDDDVRYFELDKEYPAYALDLSAFYFDRDQNIIVIDIDDSTSKERIAKFSPNGELIYRKFTEEVISEVSSGFRFEFLHSSLDLAPLGFDSSNYLYALGPVNRVYKFSPSGEFVKSFSTEQPEESGLEVGDKTRTRLDLMVGEDDNVYVIAVIGKAGDGLKSASYYILKYSNDGEFISRFNLNSYGENLFGRPLINANKEGQILMYYYSTYPLNEDTVGHIGKFSPSGEILSEILIPQGTIQVVKIKDGFYVERYTELGGSYFLSPKEIMKFSFDGEPIFSFGFIELGEKGKNEFCQLMRNLSNQHNADCSQLTYPEKRVLRMIGVDNSENLYVQTGDGKMGSSDSIIAIIPNKSPLSSEKSNLGTATSMIDGVKFEITSKSDTVKINSFSINPNKWVEVQLEGSGSVELTLPRKMIDDINLVQTTDGHPISFSQVSVDDQHTTIALQIPDDAQKINIYGARVIPEFPVFLVGIMASVIGVVLFLERVRLFKLF